MKVSYISTAKLHRFSDNVNVVAGSKLADLTESIKNVGVKEPLLVMRAKGYYVVVDGNHRLAIAESLGIKHLPCIVRNTPEKHWFREHILLNYFRGEVQLQKLIGYITRELDSGTPIKTLAERLQMREYWVMAHYEMGKVKSNDELWSQFVNGGLVKIPVLIDAEVLQRLFFDIGFSTKTLMLDYLYRGLAAERECVELLHKEAVRFTGRVVPQSISEPLNASERKIKLFTKLVDDVQNGRRSNDLLRVIIENMEMVDFARYLGDKLEGLFS